MSTPNLTKTKIFGYGGNIYENKNSHLGRITVSVILAVLMLLSTMLIGTVSTVNAVGAKDV
ncbi:MAG: hypothetical protein WBO03_00750, partial [Ruminococcus bromii]